MKNRLQSLDIFRGLTILFMIIVNTPGDGSLAYDVLNHANWHGFTPTDLVFPSFVFIVGVSAWFSFKNPFLLSEIADDAVFSSPSRQEHQRNQEPRK